MTTNNIVNPYDREKMALVQKIQDRMIKVSTAKRKVVVTFKDGSEDIFDDVDTSDVNGGCLVIYQDNINKIFKFPLDNVRRVEETLLEEKKS